MNWVIALLKFVVGSRFPFQALAAVLVGAAGEGSLRALTNLCGEVGPCGLVALGLGGSTVDQVLLFGIPALGFGAVALTIIRIGSRRMGKPISVNDLKAN